VCWRCDDFAPGLDHSIHEERVVIEEKDAGEGGIDEVGSDVEHEQERPVTAKLHTGNILRYRSAGRMLEKTAEPRYTNADLVDQFVGELRAASTR
jgi:hypothetical protein